MTSENIDTMIDKMKVNEDDGDKQADVKRAIQLVLRVWGYILQISQSEIFLAIK